MICPRCHTEMNDDVNYCPHCGMKIEKCPACHQPIINGAKFCSHCGTSLYAKQAESHIGGYYEPLQHNEYTETKTEFKDSTDFKDIPVNKKVNKKVIIIAVAILLVLSGVSYAYIYHGPKLNKNTTDTDVVKPNEPLVVGESTSWTSFTGNINQEGNVFKTEDKIFMLDDNEHLVSMDLKLENRVTLVNDECHYINVVGDMIYYTNDDDLLCSMTVEGKDQKVIFDQEVYYMIVKGDKIYYQLDDNKKEHIYVYDLTTNEQTELNDRKSYNLNVLDDKIYYSSSDGIYSIGIDGQGEEKLMSGKVANLIYQDGKLYYNEIEFDLPRIVAYDIESKKTEVIINKKSGLLNITSEYLFYLSSDLNVVRYDLKTKENKNIYAGNVEYGFVVGDKLILYTKSLYNDDEYQVIMDFSGENQQRLFAASNGTFV